MSKIKALITILVLGTSSVAMASPTASFSVGGSASVSFSSSTRAGTRPMIRDHRDFNDRYDGRFEIRTGRHDRDAAFAINITGTYNSVYGPVTLYQRGRHVTGTFTTPGGGTINGEIDRNGRLTFRWSDPSGHGMGVWYITGRGNLLQGTFGNNYASNERPWVLTKSH